MKKKYTVLALMFLMFSSYSFGQLIITELADPNDNAGARYVEIYNVSSNAVDLVDWELRRWTNGNAEPQATGVDLSPLVSLAPNSFIIIAANASEFEVVYGFAPDIDGGTSGAAASNGDDQVAIFDALDNTIDIFGVPGEDGTGTCHEFEDGRAERIASVTASNPIWVESEWNVWADSQVTGCTSHTQQPINVVDNIYDPGSWIGATAGTDPNISASTSELTGFVQFVGAPSDEQSTEVSGLNLSTDVTATVTGDYEISLTSSTGFGTNLVLTQTAGELATTIVYVRLNGVVALASSSGEIVLSSTGADNDTIALNGEILNPDPVLFSSEDTLIGFSHFVGAPSSEQTFELSGNYLTDDITVDVSGDYEISLSSAGTFSNSLLVPNIGGQVESTSVFVRLNGAAQNYNQTGAVTISSESEIIPIAHTVNAGNFYYAPQVLTVNMGDTVYWVNEGGFHNVNFVENTVSGENFNNPESFVSTPTSDAAMYSYVFTVEGTYQYDCSVGNHAVNGMVGTIIVLGSDSPESKTVALLGETLDYTPSTIADVTTNDVDGVADSLDVYVLIEGVVHCIDFDGNEGLSFTIIDLDNNGINVYNFADVNAYVVNEGDMIIILGQIDQFNGLTQVFADSIYVITSGMPTFTPTVVTALNEDTESQWITLESVNFVDPIATFPTGSNNIDVTDGTNVYTIRIDGDTDIPGGAAPQGLFDVTGVGGQYDSSNPFDSGYQLFPCGLGSFVLNDVSGITEAFATLSVAPNPFQDYVSINISGVENVSVSILDVQGRLISSLPFSNGMEINTSAWEKGMYLFTFTDENQNIRTERMIK